MMIIMIMIMIIKMTKSDTIGYNNDNRMINRSFTRPMFDILCPSVIWNMDGGHAGIVCNMDGDHSARCMEKVLQNA